MTLYKELNYTSKIREISGVQFSILSPDEIKQRSVVHVTQTLLYDANGDPVLGGLMDPRMGVIDHGKVCPTDGLDNRFCPGYFGHIELARPVFQHQFLPIVIKVLKCICIRCSRLLVDKNDPEIHTLCKVAKGKKRWAHITDLCSKVKICGSRNEGGCGAIQPTKFVKEGLANIYADWKEKTLDEANEDKRQALSAEYIHKIFKRISDEDIEILGLSRNWCRPDWLIATVLPVPPPAVRPSVKQYSNNQRSEDDITHKLIDILKTNNHLKKKMESEKSLEATIDEWTKVLQYHVATLVDNEIPNVNVSTHRSGRPLKTLRQRLKGKEGRIRGNLMGKRVNFSARSVITPDPNIKIDELGVPIKIATNLTYPEVVTKYNINRLYQYVKNGPLVHPGAKSIKKRIEQNTVSLMHVDTTSIVLNEGDIVNRHLIDGDIVLFNRQPSLHKMSMMAHKVRVMPHSTFRLNVSVTKPYNADFDGDEMNMHVPQSLQSKAELKHLAAVPLQIISPRVHEPVISPVQDTMLGLNRITNDNVYFNKRDLMNILIYIDNFDGNIPEPEITEPVPLWSGRQLLSLIIPNNVNINMKNKAYDDSKDDKLNHVIIKEGELVQGRIDKKIVNAGTKGILHTIFNDYGSETAQGFLDDVQNVVTKYLVMTGFSVGISDLIADNQTMQKIDDAIIGKKKEVSEIIQDVHQQTYENASRFNTSTEFEQKVNEILNKATGEVGNIGLKSLHTTNRMTNMVSAGSKGSAINVSQMIACVGQQNVDGKRIPRGYGDRTLPHFQKYDESPNSRGFVENSFIKGLTPQEFFFHAMGGREGLIDTAVKTSETGYIQRKLIKAMEDLKVFYDLSVRNASGNIIQFLYGEDGIDYSKIEVQHLEHLNGNYDKLIENHKFEKSNNWKTFLTKKAYDNMVAFYDSENKVDWFKYLSNYFEELHKDMRMIRLYIFKNSSDNTICYPVNLTRLITNTKTMFNISSSNVTDLNPLYVIQEVYKLIDQIKINNNNSGTLLFQILLKVYLSPKQIVYKHRLNVVAFKYIINNILNKFRKSFVQPSEMVGAIAAQSIGEPATQMTLNTFHFAGVSSKSNVTRGVPRLKELLHISKNIKLPSLTIYLNEPICYDKNKAKEVLNNIEFTNLKDITKSAKIYYDPDDNITTINEDKELLEIYKEFDNVTGLENLDKCKESNWILRLEFDKQTMIDKDITMEDIYYKIKTIYGDDVMCIYSDDNSNKLIFRIRIVKTKKSDIDKNNDINLLKNLEKNLRQKVIIKGVGGIERVVMRQDKDNYVEENNNFIKKEQWVLDTDGINLVEIMNNPNVNFRRTISNDIYEMYETLGIEAARYTLLKEIRDVITDASNYVNFRHLSLLCDIMTNRGNLMSIDRFGINRGNIGPLAKCSFEETTDQLFKAAIFGETDKLNGVSANIMMGQIAPCGTGESDIILDESKLTNIEPNEELNINSLDDIGTLDDVAEYCEDNIGFGLDISNIKADNLTGIPEVSIVE